MRSYTTYEAKAKLSELLRRVRQGETIRITYYGQEIAELRPLESPDDVRERIERLVTEGILEPASDPEQPLHSLAQSPGALDRFIEGRE